jgi:carboxypeptidase family protein
MRAWLGVTAIALVLSSCGAGDGGASDLATIRGTVVLGPMCPVENVSSPCPDQPLVGVEIQATATDGDVEATAVSGADGRFAIDVHGGDYVLQAIVDEPGRSAKPVEVSVPAGGSVRVTVPVDSGIR